MLTLGALGRQIAAKRKEFDFTQKELAKRAGIARSTLDALENARLGELGFVKITKILAALGLELTLQEGRNGRPTLNQLLNENLHDQSLDRLD